MGRFQIPVRGIHPTLVTFVAGARGAHERGHYCFWTAVLKEPVHTGGATGRYMQRRCTARARVLLPPGERFERMGTEMHTARDRVARFTYTAWWIGILKRGANIAYIRPATKREITVWAATHQDDIRHATHVSLGPPRWGAARLMVRPVLPPTAWEGYG